MNSKTIYIKLITIMTILVFSAGVFASTPVTVIQPEIKEIENIKKINGKIEPYQDIQISSKTGGIIEEVYVRVGDYVKKDQALFQFEQGDIEIQLKQVEAGVEIAQANLEKMKKGASDEQIQIAEAGVKQAEAALKIARANYKMLEDGASIEDRKSVEAAYQQAISSYEGAKSSLELLRSAYEDRTAQKQQFVAADTQVKSVENQVKMTEEQLTQALTGLEQAEKEYERIKYLYEENVATKNQYELVEIQYKNARSAVESARIAKEQADISYQGAKESYLIAEDNYTNPIQLEQQLAAAETQVKIAESNKKIASANLDKVGKGARVEELETARNNIVQAEAALASAKAQFEQLKKGASVEDIAIAEANLKQAESALQQVKKALSDTVVKSSITGIVSQINFDAGEMTGPGTPAVNIVNLDKIYIKADVTEDIVVNIKQGQLIRSRLFSGDNQYLEGIVEYISPVVDPRTQAFTIKVLVENKDSNLRGGMFAELFIPVETVKEALVVPISAVMDLAGQPYVYIINDDKVVKTPLGIGIISGDYIEVRQGLVEEDRVVIRGQHNLADDTLVEVIE